MEWLGVVVVVGVVVGVHLLYRRAFARLLPRDAALSGATQGERRRYVVTNAIVVVAIAAAALALASDDGRISAHAVVYVGVFLAYCAAMLFLVWRGGRGA